MTQPELNFASAARRDSLRSVDRSTRALEVLDALRGHPGGLTADELATVMGREPYVVRPRLTELKSAGLVITVGRRASARTGKRIAVWAAQVAP